MGKQSYKDVLIYNSGDHPFGEDVAIPHYLDWKADMLIYFKEAWTMNSIFRYALNLVPYCPIDHSPVSPSMTSRLHTAFKVLTPSRFGQRELKSMDVDSVYMPHGVPTNIYKPLEDKAECRKRFFLDPEEFVVLYVGWNRARKMVHRMLRGYARFRELNPDVKSHFLLWTNIHAPSAPEPVGISDIGINLLPEIMNLGLGEAVMWPEWGEVQKIGGLPEWDPTGGWDMVKLFNSADVLLSTTGGEGFGLTLVESQSCGVPVICTDYAAGPEQVGAGLTVKASDYVVMNTPGTKYALADIEGIANALTKIYNADREKLARRARKFSLRYDWKNVMERYFKPFLDEAEMELKPLITKEGVEIWA
ncbi:D-inositol-3-phosphate glycosyltransferase [subsurface metagenome]